MNKIMIISLVTCACIINNNAFGMLNRAFTVHAKKNHSSRLQQTYSTQHTNLESYNFELLKQLVRNRHTLKKRNTLLQKYITKQNKVIKKLQDLDNSPLIVKFLNGDKITSLAIELQELEKEIRK